MGNEPQRKPGSVGKCIPTGQKPSPGLGHTQQEGTSGMPGHKHSCPRSMLLCEKSIKAREGGHGTPPMQAHASIVHDVLRAQWPLAHLVSHGSCSNAPPHHTPHVTPHVCTARAGCEVGSLTTSHTERR